MSKLWFAPILLLVSGSLVAAERIDHTVTVTAQIPTDSFYVQPVGDWMNNTQKLSYNPFSKKLDSLNKQMEVKSTTGGIKGYLVYPPTMTSGADNIGLVVKVAGKALSTTSAELVTAADAKNGKTVAFEIVPAAAPATGYVPGTYQGTVSMVFEADAPKGG